MEVHHHSHTPRKKWAHYFWEFFMLFLAVTLGFFMENQREHYVERHRVKQYARSLVFDLQKDTAMINKIIFRIKRNVRITDSLATYLRNRPYSQIRNIELFTLSSIDRYPPYFWTRATLEQIKNSGSLRYFTNPKILSMISEYDALTHHMDEDQKNDEELSNRAADSRNTLVNMDYPTEYTMSLRNNIDSTIRTEYYRDLYASDSLKLITKDRDAIQIFLNEKLNIKKHLLIRCEDELPKLKALAEQLILLLRKQYHIKA